MLKILLIPIVTLNLLTGANSFQFSITKLLNSPYVLEKKYWSDVSIESSGNDVEVKMKIPQVLGSDFTDVSVFFANDNKEILRISLSEKIIKGSFFSLPYRLEKTMEGSDINKNIDKNYLTLAVTFPKSWLPEKWTKISASVQVAEGNIYNYYDLMNFKISIPDLMIVEEYKNRKDSS